MTTFGHERPLPAWYGHYKTLLEIAETLDPLGIPGGESIHVRVERTELQPDRFANMVAAVVQRTYRSWEPKMDLAPEPSPKRLGPDDISM